MALSAGKTDWQIYIHYVRLIDKATTEGVSIEHVQGDLHRISPTADFKGLAVDQSFELIVRGSVWMVSDSDFMPSAFIVSHDDKGKIKTATFVNTITGNAKDYVKPFVADKQLLRYNMPEDLFPIANAQRRFDSNKKNKAMKEHALSSKQVQSNIIPTPVEVKQLRSKMTIDEQWR